MAWFFMSVHFTQLGAMLS